MLAGVGDLQVPRSVERDAEATTTDLVNIKRLLSESWDLSRPFNQQGLTVSAARAAGRGRRRIGEMARLLLQEGERALDHDQA